jgi:protocatechuate 3,4-dioxygenase beta subunit
MLGFLLATLAILHVQAGQAARDAVPAGSPPATVAGRITEQETGRPLSRALVNLTSADRSLAKTAFTDADGRFEFSGVPPGRYSVVASAGDHRSTHLSRAYGQSDSDDPLAGPPVSVLTLAAAERRTDIDIALRRALGIEGRVVDPAGRPMAGVEVRLAGIARGVPGVSSQSTDDRGEYRLYGIRPGRYRVCAQPPNTPFLPETSSRLVRTCHPAAVEEFAAADVVLGADDAVGIDVQMQRRDVVSVSGTVYDANGQAAAGASVQVRALSDDGVSQHDSADSDGHYRLWGLLPGGYVATAYAGGQPMRAPDREPPTPASAYAILEVSGVDVPGFDLRLAPPVNLSGRVVFDDGGSPPPRQLRMTVSAPPTPELARMSGPPSTAPVDDALTFALAGLRPWPSFVLVNGLPEGWVVKSIGYGGRDIAGVPTTFGAEATRTRLEVHLTNRVGMPSVRVPSAEGRPIAPFRALLLPRDRERWPAALLGGLAGQMPVDGVQRLGPQLPGEYLLAVLPTADYFVLIREPRRLADLASVATPVTVVEGEQPPFEVGLARLPTERR